MDAIAKDPIKIWEHVLCAYSEAKYHDGTIDFVIIPKWKLWKTFQNSKGKDNKKMPWHTYPEEQMRKTATKYHSKTLQGIGMEQLHQAVSIVNQHEGIDINATTEPNNADKLNDALQKNKGQETPEDIPEADFTEEPQKEAVDNKVDQGDVDEIEAMKKKNQVFKAIYLSINTAKTSSAVKTFTDDVMRQKAYRLNEKEASILRDLAKQKLEELK